MGSWHKTLISVAALLVATASAEGHMGGRPSSGFHGFHGFRGFHSRLLFHNRRFNFTPGSSPLRFGRAQFAGWSGGAYSADVVGFDYDQNDDFAPDDLHFRVQDRFGPGDIGRTPPPPPASYDKGPWDAARMDPWHGYEPDNR